MTRRVRVGLSAAVGIAAALCAGPATGASAARLTARGYRDRLVVTVTGVSRAGRSGRTARVSAVWTSHVLMCARSHHKGKRGCR